MEDELTSHFVSVWLCSKNSGLQNSPCGLLGRISHKITTCVHPVCLMLVGSMCVTSSMCFCTTQMKPKQHILSPWNNSVVDGKWSLMERLAELSVYVFMYFLDPQKGETSEFLWQLQSFPLEPPSCQNFNLFARKIGILIGRWWTPFNLDTPCVSCRSDLR